MLLLFVKPDGHKSGEVAVVAIVAKKHLGCGQGGPLGNGVHFDGERLLVAQPAGIEFRPVNVVFEIPTYTLEGAKEFGVEHLVGGD